MTHSLSSYRSLLAPCNRNVSKSNRATRSKSRSEIFLGPVVISPVIGDAGNVPTVVTKGNGANPSIICSTREYGRGGREQMPVGGKTT